MSNVVELRNLPKASKPPISRTKPKPPSHGEIARRAFEIYLSRGGVPGRDVEDWLQAESELRARKN